MNKKNIFKLKCCKYMMQALEESGEIKIIPCRKFSTDGDCDERDDFSDFDDTERLDATPVVADEWNDVTPTVAIKGMVTT